MKNTGNMDGCAYIYRLNVTHESKLSIAVAGCA